MQLLKFISNILKKLKKKNIKDEYIFILEDTYPF